MKRIFPYVCCILFAQDVYEGPIMFSYSGSEGGDFNTVVDDSTNLGGALNFFGDDSSSFIMMGVSPQTENDFDLFVAVLQDTSFPVEERTWDIPGIVDPQNPLSAEALLIFLPGLDSTFVTLWLDFFTDTTNINDSLGFDSLTTVFFTELLDDMYLGIDGDLEISEVTDSTVSGNFNCSLWKPLFSFIDIDSAEFHFSRVALPALAVAEKDPVPKFLHLSRVYPNPFNPKTTISYSVNMKQDLEISVFNLNGGKIRTLTNTYHQPGNYSIQFSRQNLPSGIYIIRLQSRTEVHTQKITIIK
ncbi:MAG TPA: T9SS type A sorting domain-containing protein [Candidatus Marinimicrobia bacterium]|nr:T9SS type A sorting domain-containing protein [Candidatus Neomarinimicrobiota bacterium]